MIAFNLSTYRIFSQYMWPTEQKHAIFANDVIISYKNALK